MILELYNKHSSNQIYYNGFSTGNQIYLFSLASVDPRLISGVSSDEYANNIPYSVPWVYLDYWFA